MGVKTHGLPDDDCPAIYIVRDGRAAMVSYLYVLHNVGKTETTLADIIDGKPLGGSWSDHVAAWSRRNKTLVLRYEEISADPQKACDAVSAFTGLKQIAQFTTKFADLQKEAPGVFRVADNAKNIAEMRPFIQHFNRKHGAMMRELGYYQTPPFQRVLQRVFPGLAQ